MYNAPDELRHTVQTLLDSQIQAVLATQYEQQPYTSLMAFAVTPDLRQMVFATGRSSRKYSNLLANPQASLLIDSRCNTENDYRDAIAISAQGSVSEVGVDRYAELLQLYLNKHPRLWDFVTAKDSVLLQLEVERYYIVSQFQSVTELKMI